MIEDTLEKTIPESDYQLRFGGIARLYGKKGAQTLEQSHVMVVGLGALAHGLWNL